MRKNQALTILLGLTALTLPFQAEARRDRADFAEDVQFVEADKSPTDLESNIDDYTYQDEQINIDPEDGVIKVLRTDQKILINDYVTAIIPCRNVNPREIRGPIRTMVRKEGGDADVVQDKVTKEYFLHVVCPRFQLPFVKQVIGGLDEGWVQERADGSAELYYRARFRDIRNIQNISRFYIGPEGVGRFVIDELNNAMYYSDQPALIGLQKWGLQQIDIPPNQVSLDIQIYEINMNNDTLLGLDYSAWKNGPGRNLFDLGYFDEDIETDITNTATGNLEGTSVERNFSFARVNAITASQFLDFVQNKGYVRELVKTNVTVQSGDPAVVEAVDAVAHFISEPRTDTYVDLNLPDEDGVNVPVTLPQDRGRLLHYREAGDKVGVRVVMRPYVALQSMELEVNVDVSTVSGYTPAGSPMITARTVSDYVRLVDGQPFVLGGINRETTTRSKDGAPYLHRLPVAGWLFGREENVARKTQIVMVVTPRFITGTESVREIPQEAQTIRQQAMGEAPLEVPRDAFGFDQWLLDQNR